jgi:glycosyltransferase involved in cell wall biosynthesis
VLEHYILGDKMKVRFSVLIPLYNREKYVRQAIDSVLSQTFTDFEVIVVDDGSTDGSVEVVKSYGTRVKLIQQRNQGPEVARNTGLALAEGEYLVLLDSDDFLFPFSLATFDQIIRTFNSPPLIVGSEIYYQDGGPLPAEALMRTPASIEVLKYDDYLSKTMPLTNFNSKLAIRKSVIDEVGGFRNSTPQTWHNDDLDLMLMVGTYGPLIVMQKPRTVAYRQHPGNTVLNVKAINDGILLLARLERQGRYPGGRKRRLERYAIIGGRASTWALRYCWRNGKRKLAVQLLLGTAPMVLAALVKKSLRRFKRPVQPMVLSSVR